MYEQWIIALLIAPLAISLASFACGVTKARTICTALHVTGLILMFVFSLQVITGVLTQGGNQLLWKLEFMLDQFVSHLLSFNQLLLWFGWCLFYCLYQS